MRIRQMLAAGLAGLISIAACGSVAAQSPAAPPLKVFAAGEIAPAQYTVLRHLWVDDWRSSVYVRRYGEAGAAIAAIIDEAARAGADGVVNLYCVDASRSNQKASFLCYALAVKLK